MESDEYTKEELLKELMEVKERLVMRGYLDGWEILHWETKKKEIQDKLNQLKKDNI